MEKRQKLDNFIAELEPKKFQFFIRMVNRMTPSDAKGIAASTLEHLTRLGLQRDASKAIVDNFDGALNTDTRSLLDWAARIDADHPRAKKQLVAIDATAFQRSGG